MRVISKPNRSNLLYIKKFCSDINLLTGNIVGDLPGDYRQQLEASVQQLSILRESLGDRDKTVLNNCRNQLRMKGEHELSENLERLLQKS